MANGEHKIKSNMMLFCFLLFINRFSINQTNQKQKSFLFVSYTFAFIMRRRRRRRHRLSA